MLLKKKLLNLIYFIKKQLNYKIVLNFNIFYNFSRKYLINIFAGLNLLFHVKKKKSKKFYYYHIKIKSPNIIMFNSLLMVFYNILKNNNFNIKFNFIKKAKSYYSLTRSPFVYKSSQEQFLSEEFISIIIIEMKIVDFFFIKYWEFFFKKFLNIWFSSNVLIKRYIKFL